MSLFQHTIQPARQRRARAGGWPALVGLVAFGFALGACADSITQPRDEQARLSVSAAVAGTPIATIVITVSAADISRPLVFNLTVDNGLAAGTLHVPPGPARTFTAQGFDATGEVTHEGAATADIQKGDNGTLAIAMLPRTGKVPITITIGSVGVVVSPAAVSLTIGTVQQLDAAISQSGQPVPGAVPVWASSNPAVASVDQSGLVTAHAPGLVQIIAVFAGTAGASTVTVPAPPVAKIAFTSDRDGNNEIYVMNPDGTGQTRLTNNSANDDQAAWAPTRQWLMFMSTRSGNGEIYQMTADGLYATARTQSAPGNSSSPAWSFDGSRMAYVYDSDIYVVSLVGGGQTRLTNTAAYEDQPAWSPDGTRIAFTSDRDGNREIYVMNADGTGEATRLTNNPTIDDVPAWSPDGTRIAFRRADLPTYSDIYVMNADGTGLTLLTSAGDDKPAWSPDGARIAFTSTRDGNPEIYVMNADGTSQTRLTTNAAADLNPAWR